MHRWGLAGFSQSLSLRLQLELVSQTHSFLLLAGVNTSDIITLYISAIKALRELDPSMVILEVACEPIRKYLR